MNIQLKLFISVIALQLFLLTPVDLCAQYEIITLDKNAIIVNDPFEPKLILDMATGPEAEIRMIGTGQLELNNISDIQLNSSNGDVLVNSKINIADSSTPPAVGDIKFISDDFEGFTSTGWKSLTMSNQSQQTYAVGDYAHGGVVFWVTPDGKHGKVVSMTEAIGRFTNINSLSEPDVLDFGFQFINEANGAANTVAIANHFEGPTAAAVCLEFSYEGYEDWYLPATQEMQLIYNNKVIIEASIMANGGDDLSTTTWQASSYIASNVNKISAYDYEVIMFSFASGTIITPNYPDVWGFVRPVRAF